MKSSKLTIVLTPVWWVLSLIYGLITHLRNKLFDWQILKSTSFELPIICVGNLSVGGNGKTPMVEYLIEMLQPTHAIGVISRGYGRTTKGYLEVGITDSAMHVGDESLQVNLKYPKTVVVVCEDRVAGVNKMLAQNRELSLIIMDDGFQHRYIKPSINVLVSDSNKPFYKDYMLPLGRLREYRSNYKRASAIVFSKCKDASFNAAVNLQVPTFYSGLKYAFDIPPGESVYGFSALANNKYFKTFLTEQFSLVGFMEFKDHYQYTQNDVDAILREAEGQTIVCTEKDWVKIQKLSNTSKIKVIKTQTKFFTNDFDQWLKNELGL